MADAVDTKKLEQEIAKYGGKLVQPPKGRVTMIFGGPKLAEHVRKLKGEKEPPKQPPAK